MFKNLGTTKTVYKFDGPFPKLLESFPIPGKDFTVTFRTQEFTSLCPVTGQPDYAEIIITYTPKALCVESKSLKLYLMSFRQSGAFAETIVNQIFEDLNVLLSPKQLTVTCAFKARGGLSLVVTRML